MQGNLERLDILKNKLYLCRIHRVVSSRLVKGFLKGSAPRYSDAFVYITHGTCQYTFEDGTGFAVRKDQLLYLARDARYDMQISSDRFSFLFLDFDFLCPQPRKSAVYTLTDPAQINFQFDTLLTLFEKGGAAWECDCAAIFYGIYSALITAKANYSAQQAKRLAYAAQSLFVERLASPELTVAAVAEELNISPTHLRRLFHGVFGTSPVRFIRRARITRAANLMTVPGLGFEEIARQCGFSSYPYFCRVFREITGMTPARYRQKLP